MPKHRRKRVVLSGVAAKPNDLPWGVGMQGSRRLQLGVRLSQDFGRSAARQFVGAIHYQVLTRRITVESASRSSRMERPESG